MDVKLVQMYNQTPVNPQPSFVLSVRRLVSDYNGPLMRINTGSSEVDVYAVNYPRHPPKKGRLLNKWRKRYACRGTARELLRLVTGKIKAEGE